MPIVIVIVTLISRRWGNSIGGVIAGMPWVGGSILLFIAIEQGKAFAVESLPGAVVGLVGWLGFCMCYVWLGQKAKPIFTLIISNVLCLGFGTIMRPFTSELSVPYWTLVLFLCLTVSIYTFPKVTRTNTREGRPIRAEIPLRIIMITLFVITLTYFAKALGPSWSGILTPFPVITSTLALFTHIGQGIKQVRVILLGMYTGVVGFGSFLLALSFLMPKYSIEVSFLLALILNVFFALGAKVVFDRLKWIGE